MKLLAFAGGIRGISVEGHCDTRGSEYHNLDLGTKRAASVMKVLGERLPGVSIGVRSLGSDNPDPPGSTDADWSRNRWSRIRVELE